MERVTFNLSCAQKDLKIDSASQLHKTVEASILKQSLKTRSSPWDNFEVLISLRFPQRDFWYLEAMSNLIVHLQNTTRILEEYLGQSELYSILGIFINWMTFSCSYQTNKLFATSKDALMCVQGKPSALFSDMYPVHRRISITSFFLSHWMSHLSETAEKLHNRWLNKDCFLSSEASMSKSNS